APRGMPGEPQTAFVRPSPNTPSKASLPPLNREEVLPMCPVRCVTYVSGRSFLMDGHLTKTRGGKKGQIRPMIRFCVFLLAARVTSGRVNIYISSNSVSGRQIEVDSSVATSAFVG